MEPSFVGQTPGVESDIFNQASYRKDADILEFKEDIES